MIHFTKIYYLIMNPLSAFNHSFVEWSLSIWNSRSAVCFILMDQDNAL